MPNYRKTWGGEPVVAVGLLTARDLQALGGGFKRAFPISDNTDFADLLKLLDEVGSETPGGEASPPG